MSEPKQPLPAKLFCGMLMGDEALFDEILNELITKFGTPDLISPWMPFDYTSYYEKEMGESLKRRVFTFEKLVDQEELPDIKLFTNTFEQKYSDQGKRCVNIDPGLLVPERLVLATGKNFTHRIYLGKKIYADLTLIYKKGDFQALPWTFPDYADEPMLSFLRKARSKYMFEIASKLKTTDRKRKL